MPFSSAALLNASTHSITLSALLLNARVLIRQLRQFSSTSPTGSKAQL